MIFFTASVFDRWQSHYEEFNYAFRDFCFLQFRACEVHADFIPNVTKIIHAQWVSDCDRWLKEETPSETTELSFLKRAALLLFAFSKQPFLGNIYAYQYKEDSKISLRGGDKTLARVKRDLMDARDSALALEFTINIIHYFELNRVDRKDKYRYPMTDDMRHDLLGYLVAGDVHDKALYLILKAMFIRPSLGGSAN